MYSPKMTDYNDKVILNTAPYNPNPWNLDDTDLSVSLTESNLTRSHLNEVGGNIAALIKAKGGIDKMPRETFLPFIPKANSTKTDESTTESTTKSKEIYNKQSNDDMMRSLGYTD